MLGAPFRSLIFFLVAALVSMVGRAANAEVSPDCGAFNTATFFATATPEDVAHCLENGAPVLPALFHAVRNTTSPLIIDELLLAADERDLLEKVDRKSVV